MDTKTIIMTSIIGVLGFGALLVKLFFGYHGRK